MVQKGKVPFHSTTLLNNHVLMYAYLFLCKIGTNVGIDILTSKKLPALIDCLVCVFLEYQ
jgi:hypothetical protein